MLFKCSCPHFPTTTYFPLPHASRLPPSILPSSGFVHGSFIHVPWWPFPFFPPLSPSPLPSGYCHFVLYFNVSGCILLACWLGSTYRWDHMVSVFHCLSYFAMGLYQRARPLILRFQICVSLVILKVKF